MFNRKINSLEERLYWLEEEVEELIALVNLLQDQYIKQQNRVTFMDITLEAHEMDLEYLKANIKTKKKGSK